MKKTEYRTYCRNTPEQGWGLHSICTNLETSKRFVEENKKKWPSLQWMITETKETVVETHES
jgi:hypothetical protein